MNFSADDPNILNRYIVYGKLSVWKVQGKPVNTREKPVHIVNLSSTSITFQSDLKLPLMREFELKLELGFDHNPVIPVIGYLQQIEEDSGSYLYLLHICESESSNLELTQLLKILFLQQHPILQKVHKSYSYFALPSVRPNEGILDLTT